ncbi:MAG TPA: M15 family metallopeptidase [Ohtaekwangia sp.]|nr:M15 family metallopeptidase [Ohtaekwangia sp.]
MRIPAFVVGLTTILSLVSLTLFGQTDLLFSPYDCREHSEAFPEDTYVEVIVIDSSMIMDESEATVQLAVDTMNAWKQWTIVQNFTFGKDRGSLSMITDLNALHPYFRDKIKKLIVMCKQKGIDLAVVETYRTHAKQNEYRFMGRKYTNSTGGKSKHQYGLAVDVVPIVDSVAVWDNVSLWRKIGVAGENLGLRWGGRWKKPYDPGHFEWTGGLTSQHLTAGMFPAIPEAEYPHIDEELELLKKYWKAWEVEQSAMARKVKKANEKLN